MAKKFGDNWSQNPKKIKKPNKVDDFRPSSRFSFRMPIDTPQPDNDCGNTGIGDLRANSIVGKVGRALGEDVLYDADQIENYSREYPRFERAINLVPDLITDSSSGDRVLSFCSNESPTGYWTVTFSPAAITYFIDAGEPLLIICPVPYQITQVVSNGSNFIWEEVNGRSAVVDPENTIDPTLYIFDNVGQVKPVKFKISVAEDTTVSDELIVYTTPTSDFEAIALSDSNRAFDDENCRKVPCITRPGSTLPLLLQGAYFDDGTKYTFEWDLPGCDREFLQSTVVQSNTTGQYTDLQSFAPSQHRVYQADLARHYRVESRYQVYGREWKNHSCTFYFTQPNRGIYGDDSLKVGVIAGTSESIQSVPLGVIRLFGSSDFKGAAIAGTSESIQSVPLSVQRITGLDTFGTGSVGMTGFGIEKVNLGGVIIG